MKKEHDNRVSQFAEFWKNRYQEKHGQQYLMSFKKDYSIIKRLLKLLDSENPETSLTRLQTAAERLFNGRLKWFHGMETIGSFSTHINHLLNDHGGSTRAGCTVQPTTEQLDAYDRITR